MKEMEGLIPEIISVVQQIATNGTANLTELLQKLIFVAGKLNQELEQSLFKAGK